MDGASFLFRQWYPMGAQKARRLSVDQRDLRPKQLRKVNSKRWQTVQNRCATESTCSGQGKGPGYWARQIREEVFGSTGRNGYI